MEIRATIMLGYAPPTPGVAKEWHEIAERMCIEFDDDNVRKLARPRVREITARRVRVSLPGSELQNISLSNLAYSLNVAHEYLEWLERALLRRSASQGCSCQSHLRNGPRRQARLRLLGLCLRCMCVLTQTHDARDSIGIGIRPGDMIDGLLLQGQLGVYNMTHNALYLGGGFVAHVVVPRRAHVHVSERGLLGVLLAMIGARRYYCVFMISRLCDMSTFGLVLNHTRASDDGRLRRTTLTDTLRPWGVDIVPLTDVERVVRIVTSVQCLGIYRYHLMNHNCQHFQNAIAGAGFVSQGTRDTLAGISALVFLMLIVIAAFLVYSNKHRRTRRP